MIQRTVHYKEFSKILENIAYRHGSVADVFDDFLTLTLSALSFGRAEQLYKDTIARYRPEEQPKFGHALGALFQAYEENVTTDGGWCDVLGTFFEEHNGKFGRDAKGQFFTPETVCDFMARVTIADSDSDSPKTVMEPSCGSGRNLMALDRLHPRNRFRMFYTACDIDGRCVKMCSLNMFMHGMKGAVIHMDTLRMETWGGYRVFLPETGMGIQAINKHQALGFLVQSANENEEHSRSELVEAVDTKPKPVEKTPKIVHSKTGQVHLF